jgi:hypothetical protein
MGQKWPSLLIMTVWDFTWSLWDNRNEILHHLDIHNILLDMDAMDLSIIEKWHAGSDGLIPMERMQLKGLELETILAKCSQFHQDWLSFVQMACNAIHIDAKENKEIQQN